MSINTAQEILDEIESGEENIYELERRVYEEMDINEEVEKELSNAIYQELTIQFEDRDVWAQTLIDTV
jgi:hypothetical protein